MFRRAPTALIVPLALASIPFISAAAQSQDSASTDSTAPLRAIYSEGQANKGAKTFAKSCEGCHAPFFFTGSRFDEAWAGRAVFELWDRIRSTMPGDNPGGLSPSQYTEVVAYILRLNGYPAGKDVLPTDAEALKAVIIDQRSRPPQ